MILADTGPVVALLDRRDASHASSVSAVRRLPFGPLTTSWSCFTEAMYLLGRLGGYRYQVGLWTMKSAGEIELLDLSADEVDQLPILMDRYKNVPMDLADASLVVVAENRDGVRILTLDSDFFIYRTSDGSALDVIHCSP